GDGGVVLEKAAAVREGVGRDIDDAHHRRSCAAHPVPLEHERSVPAVHHAWPGAPYLPPHAARGGPPRKPRCPVKLMASARVAGLSLNMPRTADVTVSEPGFFTPRMVMQRCSASMTTNTCGVRMSTRASAISVVSRSCTWGRLANPSTIRASFDNPVMRPSRSGMYAT